MHAQNHVARDLFVRRARIQTVGSRKIQQTQPDSRRKLDLAFFALHRHAGIVADFLPATRQRVEERGLSAIGISRQRDFRHGCTATSITLASLRRRATTEPRTLTAIGSPPKGASMQDLDLGAFQKPHFQKPSRKIDVDRADLYRQTRFSRERRA